MVSYAASLGKAWKLRRCGSRLETVLRFGMDGRRGGGSGGGLDKRAGS